MSLQDRPVCFGCSEPIDGTPVFEALCGHTCCPSAAWHGHHLMAWREQIQKIDGLVEHIVAVLRREGEASGGS